MAAWQNFWCGLVVVSGLLHGGAGRAEICNPSVVTVETAKGEVQFHVEVADTPEARELGLMNRSALDATAGMLFVFPSRTVVAFWMKDTLIALDMLFINADGAIEFIKHQAQPNDLTPVPSADGIEARAVLEINGGGAEELGIHLGDRVIHTTLSGQTDCTER